MKIYYETKQLSTIAKNQRCKPSHTTSIPLTYPHDGVNCSADIIYSTVYFGLCMDENEYVRKN